MAPSRFSPSRAQGDTDDAEEYTQIAQFITATRGRKVDDLASYTDQTYCSAQIERVCHWGQQPVLLQTRPSADSASFRRKEKRQTQTKPRVLLSAASRVRDHCQPGRPSNTVASISPNKLYLLIKPFVVSIVEVIGCISNFRLQTAPEIFAGFLIFTGALFDDFRL
jgi:hypothetical protein